VSGNPLIASGSQAQLYLGAGFLMIVTGYAVATAIGGLVKVPAGTARRTFAFSSGVNNFGYLGIPVTAALFNDDVVGVLLVHNVGVEAAVWTVGVAMLSGWAEYGVRPLVNHPVSKFARKVSFRNSLFN
jgi:predicted permease